MAKGESGFEFFGARWRADVGLHACPLEVRGFWMELLVVMDEATPRGVLLVNGVAPAMDAIARMASCTPAEARRCLDLLLRFGVAERDEKGAIFCRSMVRDGAKSAKARAAVERRWRPDGDTGGGADVTTEQGTDGDTEGHSERDTKADTKADTKRHTKSPFPLHPLSPSESLLESSSSASTGIENRIRARGRRRRGFEKNQAVSALEQSGYRVENRGENGLRIGANTVPEADQQQAYKRVKKLLTERYGKDDGEATLLLTAAYMPEMPEHEQAKAFVERVSREHGCGLYTDRPLLPKARQGVRA